MNSVEISAEEFLRLTDRVAKLAAEYLDNIDAKRISPSTNGEETFRIFRSALPEQGMGDAALDGLPEVLRLVARAERPLLRLCAGFRRACGRRR